MPSLPTRRGFLESAATAAVLGAGATVMAAPSPVELAPRAHLSKAFLNRCIVFHKDKLLANKVAGVLPARGTAD